MKKICPRCHGNGYVRGGSNKNGVIYVNCPVCHGEGEIDEEVMAEFKAQRELGE